jgi:hypothetical protein
LETNRRHLAPIAGDQPACSVDCNESRQLRIISLDTRGRWYATTVNPNRKSAEALVTCITGVDEATSGEIDRQIWR